VTYTRGDEISRPFYSVIAEVRALAAQGVREVTLLGQNVNAYAGPMADGAIVDLATLVHHVARIAGIERIRFTTSHPVEFRDSLIEAYRDVPQLANHLHLPVQSGSDRVLALMKRGHTVLEYKQKIRRLREARPDVALSSDFIVGFPGETDDDFAKLMRLIDEVGFDDSFSFVYSARPGTPAAALADDTPAALKRERLQTLQAVIERSAAAISAARVGTVQRILVEGRARKLNAGQPEWMGRTECNRVVNFAAGPGGDRLVGQLLDMRITEARAHTLRGDLLLPEAAELPR
jgi:tRNA-2-methylthio-N6-dimethylallyladenosine synthase